MTKSRFDGGIETRCALLFEVAVMKALRESARRCAVNGDGDEGAVQVCRWQVVEGARKR